MKVPWSDDLARGLQTMVRQTFEQMSLCVEFSVTSLIEAPAVLMFYTLPVVWIMGSVAWPKVSAGPFNAITVIELQPTCYAPPH